jgi:hypothetical protein
MPAVATHTFVLHGSLTNSFDNDFYLEDQKSCAVTAFRMHRGAQAYKTE